MIKTQIRDSLSYFMNRVEWSVKVPGAVEIDREKESTAIDKATDEISAAFVQELFDLRKMYDGFELRNATDFEGNKIATWSGYKWFRNPISDRIEEITGVRSDQEVEAWILLNKK